VVAAAALALLAAAAAAEPGTAPPAAAKAGEPPAEAAPATPPAAPAERAAPALSLVPAEAKPGDAILLVVTGTEAEPAAKVEGKPVRFWRAGEAWRAIAGLPAELPVGPRRLEATAGGAKLTATLTVIDPAFRSRTLTVPPRYVEPPRSVLARMAADQKAFDAAFAQPFVAPAFGAPFDWPLRSEVTGQYGDRRVYNGKQSGQHYGLDLDAAVGTPILADNDGQVVMVRDTYQAGLTVLLWHGADLYSACFHLSKALVKPGQKVARGEKIAEAGASGRATGPHLHWGIKVAGRWIDPESVVRLGAFAR
jgi:murein DD-endopeptidase MepM/ murein hydrolase activator NlpD